MSDVDIAHGTLFQRGDGADPEVFTTLIEVIESTPPNPSRDAVETTHTQSAGYTREYKPGLTDPGEVSVELNHIPGNTADVQLRADMRSRDNRNYKILYPDGEYVIFNGFPTGLEPSHPQDDRRTLTATFKVSGDPTYSSDS